MVVVDTSALVASLTGPKSTAPSMRELLDRGERLMLSTIVLYEWLRGPRLVEELALQDQIFPAEAALPFGPDEARVAAALYQSVDQPRRREADLAIAATAIVREAELWTLNPRDFGDIPRLRILGAASV